MKYIDAEKLIALIDTKLEDLGMSGSVWVGRSVLQELKNDIIISIQQEQPEVDLDAEIAKENEKWTCYEEIGFGAKYDAKPFDCKDIERIARHFYELGLNARKEE